MNWTQMLGARSGLEIFGAARVVADPREDGRIRVLLPARDGDQSARGAWALSALPPGTALAREQMVLVAGKEENDLYVIGVLADPSAAAPRCVETGNGVRAELNGRGPGERLRVVTRDGEVLFEYDATTRRARVHVPAGDLELIAPEGNIDLTAARGIRLCARESIELRSLRGVDIAAAAPASTDLSRVQIAPAGIALRAPRLGMRADEARIDLKRARLTGQRLDARLDHVKLVARRLESAAEQVVQRAQNLYQSVRQLAQLRAGRRRTLVEGTHQIASKQTIMKSREDTRIDGKRIHLG